MKFLAGTACPCRHPRNKRGLASLQTLHSGPRGREDTQVFPGGFSAGAFSGSAPPLRVKPQTKTTQLDLHGRWGTLRPRLTHMQPHMQPRGAQTHRDKPPQAGCPPPPTVSQRAPSFPKLQMCLRGAERLPRHPPQPRDPLPAKPNAHLVFLPGCSLETKFCRPQTEPLVGAPPPVPSVPLPVFPILETALPPTRLLKPETCSHPQLLLPSSLPPGTARHTRTRALCARPGPGSGGTTEADGPPFTLA